MSDPKATKAVCITGATGFLGWHIAEAFREAGWRVTAIARPGNTKPVPPGIAVTHAPLDAAALTSVVEGSAVIVHAAGVTRARDDRAYQTVNVGGTEAVVAAANAVGAPVILISSQAASGTGTPMRPTREDDPVRPLNAYGRSKLAAEAIVRLRATAPWIILRPSAVYGPGDRQFLPLFRMASRGVFLLAAHPATAFTFLYVEDAARAVVLAADRARAAHGAGASGMGGAAGGAREVLFIGHPQPQTADDLLRNLAAVFQRRYRPVRVPSAVTQAAAWAGDLLLRLGRQPLLDHARLVELQAEGFVCSVDRARDVLGFTPAVGFSEGIERTARWYRDRGWLRYAVAGTG